LGSSLSLSLASERAPPRLRLSWKDLHKYKPYTQHTTHTTLHDTHHTHTPHPPPTPSPHCFWQKFINRHGLLTPWSGGGAFLDRDVADLSPKSQTNAQKVPSSGAGAPSPADEIYGSQDISKNLLLKALIILFYYSNPPAAF